MPDPYYRINPVHRVLTLYDDSTGGQEQIQVDPRLEYRVNILWVMPNGTARIEVRAGDKKWVGMVPETRAIHLADFELLFDGRFNDNEEHQYVIKRDVTRLSLFDGEKWAAHNVSKNRLRIVERLPMAVKLQIADNISGWVRGYSDVEITNFGYFFDGRFNGPNEVEARGVSRKANGGRSGGDKASGKDS
jgi:hypothetical protein